jgi:hypothetical protein
MPSILDNEGDIFLFRKLQCGSNVVCPGGIHDINLWKCQNPESTLEKALKEIPNASQ